MSKRRCSPFREAASSSFNLFDSTNSMPYVKGDIFYVNNKPVSKVNPNDPLQSPYLPAFSSPGYSKGGRVIARKRARVSLDENSDPLGLTDIVVKSEKDVYRFCQKKTETERKTTIMATNQVTKVEPSSSESTYNRVKIEPSLSKSIYNRVKIEDCHSASSSSIDVLDRDFIPFNEVIEIDDDNDAADGNSTPKTPVSMALFLLV